MSEQKHTAGAFDVRTIIGGLIGLYGLILLFLGVFHATDAELEKADGMNVNLWAGVIMTVFGIAFLAWARLRPVVVPDDPASTPDPTASADPTTSAGG